MTDTDVLPDAPDQETGKALAVIDQPTTSIPDRIVGLPSWQELGVIEHVARRISGTEMVPSALRNKPDAVMAVILAGRELRIPAMQSMRDISLVEGTPTPSAKLVRELILRAGHSIRRVSAPDAIDKAVYRYRRREWPADEWYTWSFSFDQAVQAGLVTLKDGKPYARSQKGKPLPWESYTPAMLRARAITSLAREEFADCIGSLTYTAEELGAEWVDEEGRVIEVDEQTPEHARWDACIEKLPDELRDKVLESFNQQTGGTPFAVLTPDQQAKWADWMERQLVRAQEAAAREAMGEDAASDQQQRADPEPQLEGSAGNTQPEVEAPFEPVDVEQVNLIVSLANALGEHVQAQWLAAAQEYYDVDAWEDLNRKQAAEVIGQLEKAHARTEQAQQLMRAAEAKA